MKKPINEEFEGFMQAVFPAVHPESQQYSVMRDTFYAGAVAMSALMSNAAEAQSQIDMMGTLLEAQLDLDMFQEEMVARLAATRGAH